MPRSLLYLWRSQHILSKSFFFFFSPTRLDSKKNFALPSWRWSHFCDKSNLCFYREMDSVHWKGFHVVSKTTSLFLCLRLLKQKVLSPFKSTESKQCLCNRYLQIKHLNQHAVLQRSNFICRLHPFWVTKSSRYSLTTGAWAAAGQPHNQPHQTRTGLLWRRKHTHWQRGPGRVVSLCVNPRQVT